MHRFIDAASLFLIKIGVYRKAYKYAKWHVTQEPYLNIWVSLPNC